MNNFGGYRIQPQYSDSELKRINVTRKSRKIEEELQYERVMT